MTIYNITRIEAPPKALILIDAQPLTVIVALHYRTRTGKEWTYARVKSMRKQHAIPTGCPLDPDLIAVRADGMISARRAAERLGVSASLVNLWVKHGVLVHDQRVSASKVWVRLTEEDLSRLTGRVADAADLPTFGSIRTLAGISPIELWQQVVDGRYRAFRVRHGQTWQWHLKENTRKLDQPCPDGSSSRQRRPTL